MDDREMIVCRCEEVTWSEILEAIEDGAETMNDIKRRTRAGMGLCQGRTCRKVISRLLCDHGRPLGGAFPEPPTFRPPIRPIKLRELAGDEPD